MDRFDDILNALMSSPKQARFTEEEIEAARRKQKRDGGTFMDNLTELTGKKLQSSYDINKEIEELNKNIQKDFGNLLSSNAEGVNNAAQAASSAADADILGRPYPAALSRETAYQDKASKEVTSADFSGVQEEAAETVFGQDELLKKLIVAFRRPFVLPEEEGHAKNTIFLTGPEDTGKHTALKAVVKALAKRQVLSGDQITTVDLSVYKNAGEDNVFLQDLYAAIMSSGQVILFENYDQCHSSYLGYLSDLVMKGNCRLSGRYISNNGQLVAVQNAFASNTVSSFSAAGKYLVFISTKNVTKLADAFGAPFVNAPGDTCESAGLTEESFKKIAACEWQELKETTEKRLLMTLSADEDSLFTEAVRRTEKGVGTAGIHDFFDRILKCLATARLNEAVPENAALKISVTDGKVIAEESGNIIDLSTYDSVGYTGEIDKVKQELDQIVGLKEIKEYVLSLEEYYQVQKLRKEAGLKTSEVSKHMIFTGNPGTGKTTIARIISRYLKAIGVLSGGQLVEVTRADLVGRYVGHTAPLTNQVIRSAIGGVLFIDEAYGLYRGKDDTFGLEAIDALVKGIEDNRDNLIVILAGYSKEMEEFLSANSGLTSRFPNQIHFPDYTGEELLAIAKIQASSKGYKIEEEAETALLTYFNTVQTFHADTAGNGRLVRNKIEEAILNQSKRLAAEKDADLSLITLRDFDLDDIDKM